MNSIGNRNRMNPFELWETVKNMELKAGLKLHLQKVYMTLCIALLSCTIGVLVDLKINIGGILTGIVGLGLIIWLQSLRFKTNSKEMIRKKMGILMAIGFLQGCSIGSLINIALQVDSGIIIKAIAGTCMIFTCFSAAAFFAPKKKVMIVGSILGSALSCMVLMSFLNFFFRSTFLTSVCIYVGLLVFCGYVFYDTAIIMTRFERGDEDYFTHSLELMIDFVAIFVRLVIILLKKEDDKKKKKRKN